MMTPRGVSDVNVYTPERVEAWWQAAPTANIGVATGAPSQLLVLDVDLLPLNMMRRRVPRTAFARLERVYSGGAQHVVGDLQLLKPRGHRGKLSVTGSDAGIPGSAYFD